MSGPSQWSEWRRAKAVHNHSGWFWDSIEIQTRGQKANNIDCLPKSDGQKIRETLERMKE